MVVVVCMNEMRLAMDVGNFKPDVMVFDDRDTAARYVGEVERKCDAKHIICTAFRPEGF